MAVAQLIQFLTTTLVTITAIPIPFTLARLTTQELATSIIKIQNLLHTT